MPSCKVWSCWVTRAYSGQRDRQTDTHTHTDRHNFYDLEDDWNYSQTTVITANTNWWSGGTVNKNSFGTHSQFLLIQYTIHLYNFYFYLPAMDTSAQSNFLCWTKLTMLPRGKFLWHEPHTSRSSISASFHTFHTFWHVHLHKFTGTMQV